MPTSRRRFLKRALSAGGGVAAAALLSACGGTTSAVPTAPAGAAPTSAPAAASGETIELTMWDNNTFADLAKQLDAIMLAYEQTQPRVKLNLVHSQDLPKTLTAIAAGTGPDIVWLWDGSEPIGSWADNNAIAPLDPYIAASNYDLNQLVPAALNTTTYRGQVYGLPLVADAYWLWWNKALFKDAGLDPEQAPASIDELWNMAEKLTKRDGDRISQLGLQLPGGMAKYQTWAYAFGADFYNPEARKLLITEPAMIEAMEDINGGYQRYGPENVDRFNSSLGAEFTPQDPFLTGQLAMKLDGDWVIQVIRDNKPEWTYPDDYGIAALPWAPGKEQPGGDSNVLRTYPLVLMQNTKHPQEAWEFIQWLQSKEVTTQISGFLINLPQYRDALSDPQLTAVPGFGKILEEFRGSQNIKSLPAMPSSAEFNDEFSRQLDLAFHGQMEVPAALQTVADKIQPVIDKAG
jgi:multiple sugar transport system substrate-binding protein